MKVLVIGGVAAGTKAAAKIKREDRSAEVTLITKSRDISYAGCGLPYYIGGMIEERSELIVNTPQKFAALTGTDVRTAREAVSLDAAAKKVIARNLDTDEEEIYTYDACVIATGARAVVPPLEGTQLAGVFTLRTPEDAEAIRSRAKQEDVRRAVVVGAGMIGLETAENLKAQGLSVTVIEAAPQILPGAFDPEMAVLIKNHLNKQGIRVLTGTPLTGISGTDSVRSVQTAAGSLPADLAVLALGVRPNTEFLAGSSLAMENGLILTDGRMATNLPDVYAAGDCVLVHNRITGALQHSAMGSSANYEGRTLAQALCGEKKQYAGVLGTGIVRLPELNAGRTGLTEQQARDAGFDAVTVVAMTDDRPAYMDGAGHFMTKLIADRTSRRLLGAQVFGPGAVDQMIDLAAFGIAMKASLEDFENLDLCYAPPFSTAMHPFVQTVYILENKLDGKFVTMTPAEYAAGKAKGYTVVDTSKKAAVPGAVYVDFTKVDGPVDGLALDEKLLLVCTRGRRAYQLQLRLRAAGYTNTKVLEGGTSANTVHVDGVKCTVSPADVTRVKGLGFLQDKRTPDRFNGRVITRNGKISAEESRVIAEAAERFGSGSLTMTSRMTVEIQGVPYDQIEPMCEYLAANGLETGGTGSKVRPVVSCKGTTCQYGLIDTFALSNKIHERFYVGYHGVKLPHKFKIAVGGCPNNCVKPDLNDLGIIGQRLPEIDPEICRGCKVCQVEKACPIHVAHVDNGLVTINPEECNHCGRCVGKCPFGAVKSNITGYKVYIGGRWGKRVAQGRALEKIFLTEDEVLDVVEKAILLFREQGITGERFADTIARIGFEKVQEQLLGDELLARKDENLAAQKHLKGGATC